MALIQKIPEILKHVKEHKKILNHNNQLFEIVEGDLLSHLIEEIYKGAQSESTKIAIDRAAPINVLKKILDKLSKIYKQDPIRSTESATDMELVNFYEEKGVNTFLNDTNYNFNLYKNSVTEIYEDPELQQVCVRSLPSMQFLPYSDDPINPLRPTVMIKFMGTCRAKDGTQVEKMWIYSEDEFLSIDNHGSIFTEDMQENEGINPYGTIPFPYITKSRYLLVPFPDSDTLKMTLLIPLLLTDLGFASKFLSNPIIYGIDVDQNSFKLSPNIFWNLKSDIEGKTPKLDVLRAEPDIEGQLEFIKNELALWLESKNIKANAIGRMTGENYASGIAMLLSEMDTTNDILVQQQIFKEYEIRFWQALAKVHNEAAANGRITERRMFSDPDNLIVNVDYREIRPFEGRLEKVERLEKEVNARFISRKAAMEELNPKWSENEIEEMIQEIEEESPTIIQGGFNDDEMAENVDNASEEV